MRRMLAGAGLAASLAALPVITACGSSAKPSAAPTPATTTVAPPSTPGPGKQFYVSIGDSYAAGYQPTTSRKVGHTTTAGFAYRLADEATINGQHLTLVNYGCGGATTVSLVKQIGCKPQALGPGGITYSGKTQAAAALAFIAAHKADVALVTVSIGGNDITSCAKAKDVTGCLTDALKNVKTNLTGFLRDLRSAAGSNVRIVGITYPDVILGDYVSSKASERALAPISVAAFKSLINPALRAAYQSVNATFVDVTTATGAYIPFSQTTQFAPYGKVPVAVAKVCRLTYFCQFQDIHPRDDGYQLIADLIKKTLPA